MRVRVVRTPGELRDSIGHKVMIRKDWEGEVVEKLTGDAVSAAGYHPKVDEVVYMVRFDEWEQPIAIRSTNLVFLSEEDEESD